MMSGQVRLALCQVFLKTVLFSAHLPAMATATCSANTQPCNLSRAAALAGSGRSDAKRQIEDERVWRLRGLRADGIDSEAMSKWRKWQKVAV